MVNNIKLNNVQEVVDFMKANPKVTVVQATEMIGYVSVTYSY